ncbi:hypothetical protein [Sagittula sp.]|uniref:hypothetical protein n=1 Tax=Sagittula sp. TaxID=2038081 RepID=UPI0035155348
MGHKFLSAVAQAPNKSSILFEVCNVSDESSAFLWPAAGFGIDSRAKLPSELCAEKSVETTSGFQEGSSYVHVVGQGNDSIESYLSCEGPLGLLDACGGGFSESLSRYISTLRFFISTPGTSNISMETISIRRTTEDGITELHFETSDRFQYLIVTFPEATNLEVLEEIFGSSESIEINTFPYFLNQLENLPEALTVQNAGESAAIRISRTELGVDVSIKSGLLAELGKTIYTHGIIDGEVAALSFEGATQ